MANTSIQVRKKFHIIYKTVNLINENIYVGAHSTDVLEDGYLGSGYKLQEAIVKYGKENFKREILHIFDCPMKMFEKEKEIVNENFIKSRHVYNIVTGGYGGYNRGSKDLKHMHHPHMNKRCAVHKNAVEKMLNEGWVLGRNMSSTSGRIWIHKDDNKMMVAPDELESYYSLGWKKGLPKSPTKGKIWIYNEKINKYSLCLPDELEGKVKEGWIKKKWAPSKSKS